VIDAWLEDERFWTAALFLLASLLFGAAIRAEWRR
jgi:hypothetical protein